MLHGVDEGLDLLQEHVLLGEVLDVQGHPGDGPPGGALLAQGDGQFLGLEVHRQVGVRLEEAETPHAFEATCGRR